MESKKHTLPMKEKTLYIIQHTPGKWQNSYHKGNGIIRFLYSQENNTQTINNIKKQNKKQVKTHRKKTMQKTHASTQTVIYNKWYSTFTHINHF